MCEQAVERTPCRAEQILYGKRNTFKRPGFALRDTRIGRFRHVGSMFRRFEHIGIERPRLLDGRQMCGGQFGSGEGFSFSPSRASAKVSEVSLTHGAGSSDGRERYTC